MFPNSNEITKITPLNGIELNGNIDFYVFGTKKGFLGPNSELLWQKMTQKSSFSNFDETFHFYSIFHVEYENQTQNSSKALKTEEGGVCLGPTLQKPSSRKSSAFDTQGLMGLGFLSHNRLNSYIFFIEFSGHF